MLLLSNGGSMELDPAKLNRLDIKYHEQVVNLTPDGHDDKTCYLSDLGKSLSHRFEHSGDLADCDRAILVQEQAVSIAPNGNDDKPEYMSNLVNSFLCRFDRRPG